MCLCKLYPYPRQAVCFNEVDSSFVSQPNPTNGLNGRNQKIKIFALGKQKAICMKYKVQWNGSYAEMHIGGSYHPQMHGWHDACIHTAHKMERSIVLSAMHVVCTLAIQSFCHSVEKLSTRIDVRVAEERCRWLSFIHMHESWRQVNHKKIPHTTNHGCVCWNCQVSLVSNVVLANLNFSPCAVSVCIFALKSGLKSCPFEQLCLFICKYLQWIACARPQYNIPSKHHPATSKFNFHLEFGEIIRAVGRFTGHVTGWVGVEVNRDEKRKDESWENEVREGYIITIKPGTNVHYVYLDFYV